ncbi:MAG: VOC family protein, partial [Albidovulum sp.]|uniref:VOC family protein n=1 Tax=Albidovulum sp. TaxID=1872424 RepID=UPI003C8871A1
LLCLPNRNCPTAAAMTTPLGRIVIYTKKTAQMAEFYTKHFGFSISRAKGDRILELKPQAAGVSILLHPASVRQKEGQALVKLVFDVEDVVAFCEAARGKGLKFGKIHQADGYVFANAKDPAGNSVQVSSRAFVQR